MKVNVPKQGDLKRYKHDLKHDVSTTSDVGFLQPFMIQEFPGNSHCKVTCGQIVRFANMVKPTFGEISLNTYNVFVPIESIYHPYESLRTQQTYMGANATYIPQSVIKVSPFILNIFMRCMSDIEVWTASAGTLDDSDGSNIVFAAGAFTNVTSATTGYTYIDQMLSDWNGMAQDFDYQSSPATIIKNELASKIGSDPRVFKVSTSSELGDVKGYDWIYCMKGSGSTPDKVFGGRYHRAARNIRKVLYAAGFKLFDSSEPLTFLPVMAYYKAWFDLFAPQRNTTWKDEAFAGFQEYCEQYGKFIVDDFLDVSSIGQPGELFVQMILDLAKCYITQNPDFVSAHITGQRIGTTPNITAPYYPGGRTLSNGYVSTINSQVPTLSDLGTNDRPNATALANLLTPMGLELLQKVQKRTNVHTALGGRVRELLKSITGDDYLGEDRSYWIGAQKVDVVISPVFNTAESSEAALGQFAGAAFGSSAKSEKTLTYDCDQLGFWVCFGTMVPDSRFAQGMNMMLKHVGQYDFYDPMIDSSTMVPTPKKYIFAERQIAMRGDKDLEGSFGNVPAQIEYCVHQNLQNGDMSLMSTRASYLPWTLDKLLPYDNVGKLWNGDYIYRRLDPDLLVNGTIWRFIGLSRWIGQYDRIWEQDGGIQEGSSQVWDDILFYNGSAIDDNITVQCTIFANYWHSKLPVRDSYHTGVIDDGMTVEMA